MSLRTQQSPHVRLFAYSLVVFVLVAYTKVEAMKLDKREPFALVKQFYTIVKARLKYSCVTETSNSQD